MMAAKSRGARRLYKSGGDSLWFSGFRIRFVGACRRRRYLRPCLYILPPLFRAPGCGCGDARARGRKGPDLVAMNRLITAHKILIVTAVIFFIFFALWEYRNFLQTNNGWALFRAALYVLVAIGFGVYFKKLKQWYK
jgi:hypothetical protein